MSGHGIGGGEELVIGGDPTIAAHEVTKINEEVKRRREIARSVGSASLNGAAMDDREYIPTGPIIERRFIIE